MSVLTKSQKLRAWFLPILCKGGGRVTVYILGLMANDNICMTP